MSIHKANWPQLYDALSDILDATKSILGLKRKPIDTYDDLTTDEQQQVIAALIKDIPDMDAGELMYMPPNSKEFLGTIASFIGSEEDTGAVLRREWIKGIGESYRKLINEVIDEVQYDIATEVAQYVCDTRPYYRRPLTHRQELINSDNRERLRGIWG